MKRWEERLSRLFDGVITVSEHDASICRNTYQLKNVLGHVPTGVDLAGFQPRTPNTQTPEKALIGFLGSMDWQANIEAVRWFLAQIWPQILAELPGARFRIIGRNPPAWLVERAAADATIEVTGTVADIRPHALECDLMVVPLKAGSGTRLKILECMAMGLPVISTTIGAEGLPFNAGKDLLIADDTPSFQASVLQLMNEPETAAQISRSAREKVETKHSWSVASDVFLRLCEACLSPTYS